MTASARPKTRRELLAARKAVAREIAIKAAFAIEHASAGAGIHPAPLHKFAQPPPGAATAPLWWKLKEAYVENVDARVTNSPRLFRTHRKARDVVSFPSPRERVPRRRAHSRASFHRAGELHGIRSAARWVRRPREGRVPATEAAAAGRQAHQRRHHAAARGGGALCRRRPDRGPAQGRERAEVDQSARALHR